MHSVEPPQFLDELASEFNDYLAEFLTKYLNNESPLNEPLKYALLGEGKRVRPILSCLTSDLFQGPKELALQAGLALEFVHTYSLIHDDLPCMDDDTIRRGKPTLHIEFDEATALLVGDALLTDSFGILAGKYDSYIDSKEILYTDSQRIKMINELSFSSGSFGMAKGQSLDLYWENRSGGTVADLEKIHFHKTGCLFKASCVLGAISSGASNEQIDAMRKIGQNIGLIFQIADDILDYYDDTGKTKGKDQFDKKLTYVSILGEKGAKEKVEELSSMVSVGLRKIADKTSRFEDFIRFLGNRIK